jgi:Family of unknown function (DUF5677)
MFEDIILKGLRKGMAGLDDERVTEALKGEVFAGAIADAVPAIAESLVGGLSREAPDMLAERAGDQAGMREQVRRTFGPGLDICEMLLRIAGEMGDEFSIEEFGEAESVPVVPFTLAHLLARTCRIGEETLLLLKNGWGLGAYARWRAMHEVAVFCSFIAEHGEETARRYVEHHPVQRWQIVRGESRRLRDRQEDVPDELTQELAQLDTRIGELRAEFGGVFTTSYGWAAAALEMPANSDRGPTLREIEEHAGFGHLRRYYQEASASVHPVAAAVLVPDDATLMGSTLLTAPSLSGLVTPAHAMCLTLTNATAAVLMSRDSWAAPFVIKTMHELSERAGQELSAAWNAYEAKIMADDEGDTTNGR